ncbi:lipoprotein-releasing ABC transporter ATP-binding protein LolD [Buchnera aphidicola]|uniref:Lipoprotein-releasing system ATP-binding protein LolD n=1 Tax=Buchnera aphidicola subsp. Uroleucon sonchi TaxID=118118 RepID=A0A6C1F6C6_BUCUN|nr:lipoprotein-releasing ABC transporter ATP-binding protein LolD [Buchnera aphidicola]QIE02011.1 lipoprotein-releasing ABC transporter ATP-binding protein LolD [Buchnera aphidicola (Uroleucon sonchi)]
MNNIIIECTQLSKSYKDGDINYDILRNISFQLKKGDIAGIIGESGSGKTTFLHVLSSLDSPTSGRVSFNGKSFDSMTSNEISQFRNKKLGFIYQFHHLMLDFSVLENVAMPLLINNKNIKKSKEIAYNMLQKVKLENKIKKYPSEISGGERQRVAIARAFVNKPDLIIADEPTGNLDKYHIDVILNLICEFNVKFNTSFIIVTHDYNVIKKIPFLFHMKNGKLFNHEN